MSTKTCRGEYVRPGGRQRGDRIVRCHLPAGHPGEHEEADTEITWTDAAKLWQSPVHTTDVEPDGYGWPRFGDAALLEAYERGRSAAAADPPEWLIEILHVAWAFARREHEGQMVTFVPEHARAALAAVPTEVLRAAEIAEGKTDA